MTDRTSTKHDLNGFWHLCIFCQAAWPKCACVCVCVVCHNNGVEPSELELQPLTWSKTNCVYPCICVCSCGHTAGQLGPWKPMICISRRGGLDLSAASWSMDRFRGSPARIEPTPKNGTGDIFVLPPAQQLSKPCFLWASRFGGVQNRNTPVVIGNSCSYDQPIRAWKYCFSSRFAVLTSHHCSFANGRSW